MYCSLSDLQKYKDPAVYVQITNDDNGSAADEDIVDEIINKSCNIIDSFIAGRYALPLSVTPNIIRNIAIDLTVKFLYDRRLSVKDEIIEYAYSEAMKLLGLIRDGKLCIPELEEADKKTSAYGVSTKCGDRFFTDKILESF